MYPLATTTVVAQTTSYYNSRSNNSSDTNYCTLVSGYLASTRLLSTDGFIL